ncbi:helix-turn-helix transcriptional regulator [Paenibacillus sp. 598K]|uniref:helix-turn-helix transcriptional regulator n=1 Tax=Paenibacillus sp. 598K TaxID=1117987 RepID=UPI000FFE3B7E|nr:helix-turn-helix domain-containing protein [Paenibacillus sp. 598K]
MSGQEVYRPKCRPMDGREFAPSVHWASYQQVPRMTGEYRRLYDFELMYVVAGEMQVQFGDLDSPIDYYAGDLLFIPAMIPHRIDIPLESGARLLGIHFDFYDEFELESEIGMLVDEANIKPDSFCNWPVNEQQALLFARKYQAVPPEIVSGMDVVAKEHRTGMSGHEMMCRSGMLQVIATLLRCQTASGKAVNVAYRDAFEQLADELQQAWHIPWTIARMAQRLNVSEDHFIRLFKEFFGKTPYQHLQHIRLQEAKRCLRETDMKIEAIARHVGYSSLYNFSHAFKKWQGVSPREYRRMGSIL